MTKKPSSKKPITSTKHGDKRTNIPTEELRDFVAEDEKSPEIMRYPRDPSLDPQLVWKGKDEQDGEDLVVPAVPIYIQEKIHPQAIIEDVRAQAKKEPTKQLEMFADFNGLPFDELIEFYQHQQNWTNRMILGDSLQVMTSLAEKEGLKGQVQMIYIDPPYGIKFGSNWQVSTRKRDIRDGKAEDVVRQPEQVKAYRDTWQLGIHSYLAYLRDRLVVAHEMLTDSGSIFMQISNVNVHLVRLILDEVFGSENSIATIVWKKGMPQARHIMNAFNYLLWYAKEADNCRSHKIFTDREANEGSTEDPSKLALRGDFPSGENRSLTADEKRAPWILPEGTRILRVDKIMGSNGPFAFDFQGKAYDGLWKGDPQQMQRLMLADRITETPSGLGYKFYVVEDSPKKEIPNWWDDTAGKIPDMIYVVQTNSKIIERCILLTTDPGDIILDPTCGAGTTAYVAEQWGRRWITIDTSRVSLALARSRLMAAQYPYYLLADSIEGERKQSELRGKAREMAMSTRGHHHDIHKGFVYETAPHITLKDIANNEEVEVIHDRFQEEIKPLLKELGRFEGLKSLPEWELPREADEEWPREVKDKLAMYWELRRERQIEINASIARNSENETLYNKPYEDTKKLRVTGPFTVESLSPHRVLAVDEPRPSSQAAGEAASGDFSSMILENLKKAGVQNTIKNERLKFDRLEPFAGEWLQAEGDYTEKDETVKRVAVCIGPEHGTVGPQLIKEAAKEAVRGVSFDLLLVCGFAFDPHVNEEIQRYGELAVLPVRMNPDLAMGDTLLKKTGAGNLFMVFGEPDVEIKTRKDGQLVVEIRGLDIYDPTTGQIRSSSTDDIACWFIDTEYNEESFFVRHAYFTGADKPYDKLKRTLRAEINEEAWESLYRTTSRPFDKPESGKIAIKVINHYGDEVLKVYQV